MSQLTTGMGSRGGFRVPVAPPVMASRPAFDVVVRPTGLKVIAIAGIAQAVLTMMGLVMTGMKFGALDKGADAIVDTVRNSRFLTGWTLGTSMAALAFALLLVLSSMATLTLKRWARSGMLIWAIGWMLLNAANLGVNFTMLYPMLKKALPTMEQGLVAVAIVFGVIWPAFVIWYMGRANVNAAFKRAEGGARIL